jgi:uncharacterized small protein (DUF1192 family)
MNRKWAGIFITLAFAGLSGCATMSGDECAMSDWTAIGYSDGAQGYPSDRYSRHNKACAKHGVTPDFRAYQDGRDGGLREYCQPARGYQLGQGGSAYHGVCSADLEPAFLDAYRVGSHLYTLRSNVSRASSSIAAKEREMERVRDKIKHSEARLIDDETTTEDRVLLLSDLKELSERSGELDSEIKKLYADRARFEVELQNYQASVASYGY